MDLASLTSGVAPPDDLFVVIENPRGGRPVKYEIDKASGAVFVDRFLHTAMSYPGDYGFIPHTLSQDGDPCDVLVVSPVAVVPGAVIRCRPVGALLMRDEAGPDEKIIAVPVDKLHPYHAGMKSCADLQPIWASRSGTSSPTTRTWSRESGRRPANGSVSTRRVASSGRPSRATTPSRPRSDAGCGPSCRSHGGQ